MTAWLWTLNGMSQLLKTVERKQEKNNNVCNYCCYVTLAKDIQINKYINYSVFSMNLMFQFHSVGSFYQLWYYSSCSMTTSQLANKDVFYFPLLFLAYDIFA